MDIRFVLVAAGAAVVISVTSLVWPKFTAKPRPAALQTVHDVVVKTPPGQRLSDVLGVRDEANIQPVNISSVAGSVAGAAVSALTQRAQQVVVTQATSEIAKQYDQLSSDQKQALENIICKPNKE